MSSSTNGPQEILHLFPGGRLPAAPNARECYSGRREVQ